jgi:hypothetical protein
MDAAIAKSSLGRSSSSWLMTSSLHDLERFRRQKTAGLNVLADRIETGIPPACAAGLVAVRPFGIAQHGFIDVCRP